MKLILTLTVCLKVGKVIKFKITMFVVKLKCVFENYNVVSIRIQEQQKHTTVLQDSTVCNCLLLQQTHFIFVQEYIKLMYWELYWVNKTKLIKQQGSSNNANFKCVYIN